jgi:hypothetical protein
MCMEIRQIKASAEGITSLVRALNNDLALAKSVEKRAYYYAQLKQIKELAETQMESLKEELIAENVTQLFPEEDFKVYVRESANTYVDKDALFSELTVKNRLLDFVKIASVSQKSLGTLDDGKVLCAQFVKEGTEPKKSLIVSALSKADQKAI